MALKTQSKLNFKTLMQLLAIPTAPFFEFDVLAFVESELKKSKIPHFFDDAGNLLVGPKSKADYLRKIQSSSKEALRIYIAHTDHPGFQGVKWKDSRHLEFVFHGGSPTKGIKNAPMWMQTPSGKVFDAKIKSVKLEPKGRWIESGVIETSTDVLNEEAKLCFGGFRFRKPAWKQGTRIWTKAADDLVGVYAILETARTLWKSKDPQRQHFVGLVSRAEEVGYVGAIAHFREFQPARKAKRRPLVAVSLEASRTLPEAEMGKGPVVRLGDKSSVFHSGYSKIFLELARKQLPDSHQSRVMNGGTCEATCAQAFGIPAIGISVPLENYHNQNLRAGTPIKGKAKPGAKPESVDVRDIQGELELCHALMTPKLSWVDPWANYHVSLDKIYREYEALLNLHRFRN